MAANPYTLGLLHPNMTCADCEKMVNRVFISDTLGTIGNCTEGTERLVQDGYPRIAVMTFDYKSAESCPDFDQSAESRADAPVNVWDERDCAETHRWIEER